MMKPVDRQKICPNCDGRVAYDATQCTYCFATLQVDNSAPKIFTPPAPPSHDALSGLYTPPYSAPPHSSRAISESIEPKTAKTNPIYAEKDGSAVIDRTEPSETKSFWPLFLLVLGGNLLTLSILQFFFSDHGVVRLEINGSYWFLMLLASLPLFYFGFKGSSQE
ncbi:MAG TPA: hypothetical protein VHK67_04505 [Rhabdochlamydiaceae bacterium]|jgi:hypothetical protein|nr:hypothetical protein [Rhabdochlamydiaceae bacterium]